MKSSPVSIFIKYCFIILATAVVFYPSLWMITMAFKPYPEWTTVGAGLSWFPKNPTWQNFEFIFYGKAEGLVVSLDRTIVKPFISSLLCATLGTLLAVVCGTISSYAVVRFKMAPTLPLSVLQLRLFPPISCNDTCYGDVGIFRSGGHVVGIVTYIWNRNFTFFFLVNENVF